MRSERGAPATETPRVPLTVPDRPVSGCSPEAPKRPHIGRVSELLECALANLPDALPSDSEQGADFLQGEGFGSFFQAVIQRQDLPFPRGQMPLKDPVD